MAQPSDVPSEAEPVASRTVAVASPTTKFDRERLALYVGTVTTLLLVAAFYVAGYLLPALSYARAIVEAAKSRPSFPPGCYLLFMEHANRLQSVYTIRFLGMLIGIAVAFVGMLFTIKGLEAGYSLDVSTGGKAASLRTASPGLVLCTLGLGVVLGAVLHSSDLTFQNTVECFGRP